MGLTLTPEVLKDLRGKAKDALSPHARLGPGVDYYAAVAPSVVLALLDRIEALEAEVRGLDGSVEDLREQL